MNALAKVIRGLGWLWVGLAALLNLAVHAMILVKQGFWALQEELSPFNVRHLLTVAITFAPGAILLMLADAIRQRRARRVLLAIVALPIAVGLVILLGVGVTALRETRKAAVSDRRTTEYKATAVRVVNRSAVMHEHRSGLLATTGPIGQDGIPDMLRLGDTVTVKGRTIRIRHIFVTEIHEDLKWAGKVLAKKGDIRCIAVESEDQVPHNEEKRDKLWIYIPECQPLGRP